MNSDFEMICHEFPGDIVVYPIADVHLGAAECAEAEWDAFCKKVLSSPNTYLILAGDLLNNGVRTSGFVNPFEERYRPRDAKRMMVEYLTPIRDRITCVVSGNHERRNLRDDDQDLSYDICAKLDIEDRYRENIAFMKLSCGKRSNSDRLGASYMFAVTHGAGGGVYTGTAVNRDERYGNLLEGIDCIVAGHVHKGFISKPSKIVIDPRNNIVSMRHYTVISCVSWLNYGGYAAQKMLLPSHVADPQALHLYASNDGLGKRIETRW